MAVYENSRYLNTTMFNRLGTDTQILRVRSRHQFNMQNCTVHEWCEGDTLDGIAFKYYGACALRWAILDANPKYRTEFDIECGDLVNIPNYEEVVNLVNVK